MPLSASREVNDTADVLVKAFRNTWDTPNAFRPAHAKGRLTKGVFTPSPEAAELSKAIHFNNPSTPVLIRFSNSSGLPNISDKDPNASPRGIGIRFVLGDDGHRHTDIVAHSTAFFPTRTAEEFLKMLGAMGDGSIGKFLQENPAALAFVQDAKPFPASFATERFFSVNAFKLISQDGKERFVRYKIVPESYEVLSDPEMASKSESYLFDELVDRLAKGPPITFKLVVQIAEEGDITDDATKHWPDERKVVELGVFTIEEAENGEQSVKEQKRIIFDPIPRVDGVEASADPLLDMRAAVYLLSGRVRRAAE